MDEFWCPQCMGNKNNLICRVTCRGSQKIRFLMKCRKCQLFFFDDTGEIVTYLAGMCQTKGKDRDKCHPTVLNYIPIPGLEETDKEIVYEIDKICAGCEHKNFVLY